MFASKQVLNTSRSDDCATGLVVWLGVWRFSLSSQSIHNLRRNTIESAREFLKKKKKVTEQELTVEMMKRSFLSKVTLKSYVDDLVSLGICRRNGNGGVEYVFHRSPDEEV